VIAFVFGLAVQGVSTPHATGTFLLPLECSELLPDHSPFVRFLEAVARGGLKSDKRLSERLYKVLAMRERMNTANEQSREQNPVDILIRKTLCFYREKKEPLKTVTYDDALFLSFLRTSLADLESKLDETIFQREFDKQQRKEYERLLTANKEIEDSIRRQAELEADRSFERISNSAKRKVRAP
jgi:hypothetical protein